MLMMMMIHDDNDDSWWLWWWWFMMMMMLLMMMMMIMMMMQIDDVDDDEEEEEVYMHMFDVYCVFACADQNCRAAKLGSVSFLGLCLGVEMYWNVQYLFLPIRVNYPWMMRICYGSIRDVSCYSCKVVRCWQDSKRMWLSMHILLFFPFH